MTDDPKLQMARRAEASVWAKQGDQEFADRIMAGNDDFCEEVQAALAAIEECTEAHALIAENWEPQRYDDTEIVAHDIAAAIRNHLKGPSA